VLVTGALLKVHARVDDGAVPPSRFLAIDVDGERTIVSWGDFRAVVPPGVHSVRVSFQFLGMRRGRASLDVHASDGETIALQYRPGWHPWLSKRGRLWEDRRYTT
jgi:hypothetical protein